VLAANEIGSNSLMYGGGDASVRMWRSGTVVCEVSDKGVMRDPLVGRSRPGLDEHDTRGMWIVNQVCDLVQIRSSPDGTVVRLHMRS
jgi:two-component sensor histidine kinase